MTVDKKLKKAVRERMKVTGESYMTARANLMNELAKKTADHETSDHHQDQKEK